MFNPHARPAGAHRFSTDFIGCRLALPFFYRYDPYPFTDPKVDAILAYTLSADAELVPSVYYDAIPMRLGMLAFY